MVEQQNIKHIIAIASGKGGVGKSTVALNLALALAKNAKVGLLDADIYGPSQPTMLGTQSERPVLSDKGLNPIAKHGLETMSMGYLVEPNAAMMWRGPMLGKALEQLMHKTNWGKLDYLLIDLPPGTGDVQLSMCQKMKIDGAVMITTPQDIALIDVRRACEMFKKLNVPILGVIENMSGFQCTHCGHEHQIFGLGAGNKLADEFGCGFLGSIPLNLTLREMTDSGQAQLLAATDTQLFFDIAEKIQQKLVKKE